MPDYSKLSYQTLLEQNRKSIKYQDKSENPFNIQLNEEKEKAEYIIWHPRFKKDRKYLHSLIGHIVGEGYIGFGFHTNDGYEPIYLDSNFTRHIAKELLNNPELSNFAIAIRVYNLSYDKGRKLHKMVVGKENYHWCAVSFRTDEKGIYCIDKNGNKHFFGKGKFEKMIKFISKPNFDLTQLPWAKVIHIQQTLKGKNRFLSRINEYIRNNRTIKIKL